MEQIAQRAMVQQRQEAAGPTGVLDFQMVRSLTSEFLLPFPVGLKEINLRCTAVTELPDLPEGLTSLWCDKSPLRELPKLPSTLQYLSILRTHVKELPELPEGLIYLQVDQTEIKTLPKLPHSLKQLSIGGSWIEEVLELPPNLEQFSADNDRGTCSLQRIGMIPASLKVLNCTSCQNLKEIGPISEGVKKLHLSFTGVEQLPPLPSTLTLLDALRTPIQEFPKGQRFPGGLKVLRVGTLSKDCILPSGLEELEMVMPGDVSTLPELPLSLKKIATANSAKSFYITRDLKAILEGQEWRRMRRQQGRCAALKEELMAAVWHPKRRAMWESME